MNELKRVQLRITGLGALLVAATVGLIAIALTMGTAVPLLEASEPEQFEVRQAQLNQGQLQLRVAGAKPSAPIVVPGLVRGTADENGDFSLQMSNVTPPPGCTLTIIDGNNTHLTATLDPCTGPEEG